MVWDSQFRIPWGMKADTGRMVHVEDVPTGKLCGCICPGCRKMLIAKNTGRVKAHHFAHSPDDAKGTCESFLHGAAKRLLYDRIIDARLASATVAIEWRCKRCSCRHTGDLLKNVTADPHIETLISEANIRPDIWLEQGGQPSKLLEVVVTHPPETPVWQYAEFNGLPLLLFNIVEVADLDKLVYTQVLQPDIHYVERCLCGPCPYCKSYNCSSCSNSMQAYCDQCGACGSPHKHCSDCQEVIVPDRYGHDLCGTTVHDCCHITKMFDLSPCPPRHRTRANHRHCMNCGQPMILDVVERRKLAHIGDCYSHYDEGWRHIRWRHDGHVDWGV